MLPQEINRLRIYLIDHELIVIKTIQSFLTDLGHKVRTFISVPELLANQTNGVHPVDAIMFELNVPEADGVKMIREIHRLYPDTAIIIMTDHGPILPVKEAISQGVYTYINKPIRLAELELVLIRLAESRALIKSGSKTDKD